MSLGRFARRMRELSDDMERNIQRRVRETALACHQTVTLATPVDTGRARGNWIVAVGAPVRVKQNVEDPTGVGTIAAGRLVIRAASGESAIYISNNVPYIGVLNEGSSAQAPAMFVEQAIQTAVSRGRRVRITDRR